MPVDAGSLIKLPPSQSWQNDISKGKDKVHPIVGHKGPEVE